MNLGYALLVEGELPAAVMERAVRDVLRADPLLEGPWLWRVGNAEREQFAALSAEHLSTPLARDCPFSAALRSSSRTTHLLLLAIHHLVADGIVLERLASDLSRALQGKVVEPVSFAPQRSMPAPQQCEPRPLLLPPAAPSVRASCHTVCLPPDRAEQFSKVTRSWRATPFAGAVTCVTAAAASWSGQPEVGITIQMAGRNSSDALRAPGPWYDFSNLCIAVAPGEPLRGLLLQVSEQLVKSLATAGRWAAGRCDDPSPELLVVYDRHPLSALAIPGCRVTPLSVQRHPQRAHRAPEYLVATEADIVVFFREQLGSIGLSLFTKIARVPEAAAHSLLDTIVDAVAALCDERHYAAGDLRLQCDGPSADAPRVAWPEPAFSDVPLVDAVSPVFRLRPDTLTAFARDAQRTLAEWGTPPWHRTS